MKKYALFLALVAAVVAAMLFGAISVSPGPVRFPRWEIDAVGTEFHFPAGAPSRSDRLELPLAAGSGTLFTGPVPDDDAGVQEWLSMTWPGGELVVVSDRKAFPTPWGVFWMAEFLIDHDPVPNARALLLGVGDANGDLHGTVILLVGPGYRSESAVWGPTPFFDRLTTGLCWRYRATWEDPDSTLRMRLGGHASGVGKTIERSRLQPLLERVAGVIEGLESERIRSICASLQEMAPASQRTWCLRVEYRGQGVPLILETTVGAEVFELSLTTSSFELSQELQGVLEE